MSERVVLLEDLFKQSQVEDLERRVTVMSLLGRVIEEEEARRFEDVVRHTVQSGVVDVTGWTRAAIRALLHVCSGIDASFTFRTGDRELKVVRYPNGPMLDILVESLVTGQF